MTRQRCPFFQASRNAGVVSTVSARALIEENPILLSFAHHGIRPHRICCGTRLPSWLRIATSIGSVGHTFHDAGIFGAGKAASNFSRILMSENSVERRTRPHMVHSDQITGVGVKVCLPQEDSMSRELIDTGT